MREWLLGAASAALVLLGGRLAQAQFFHPRPKPPPPTVANPQDSCTKMAAMPNAPMTYQACMQMIGGAATMQNAMDDPSAQRPGDQAMTCDQIKAEFIANGGLPMNQQDVAQAQAAGADFQAKNTQIQAEAHTLAVQEAVANTAAAATSMVPGVGTAAAAAANAHNTAVNQAFSAHATAVLSPAEQQMTSSTGVVMNDMATSLQKNPRQARLMSLAMQKNCH
jgi:hypothetical protein